MEVEDICKTLEISNLEMKKSDIKNAVSKHHAEELRGQMGKKMKDIMNEEIGQPKDYMSTTCIADARLQFRIRTNMVECKGNMKGQFKDGDYTCPGCNVIGSVEDQSHILRCSAYEDYRQGLDLAKNEDLIKYFRKVMIKRMKIKQ